MYDVEKLTDEQLEEKISKCYQHMGMEVDFGHHSLVESMKTLLEQLELEQALRSQKKQHDMVVKELDKHHMKLTDPLNIGKIDLPDEPPEEE